MSETKNLITHHAAYSLQISLASHNLQHDMRPNLKFEKKGVSTNTITTRDNAGHAAVLSTQVVTHSKLDPRPANLAIFVVRQITKVLLPSTSFTIQFSPNILPIDTVQSELQTASIIL